MPQRDPLSSSMAPLLLCLRWRTWAEPWDGRLPDVVGRARATSHLSTVLAPGSLAPSRCSSSPFACLYLAGGYALCWAGGIAAHLFMPSAAFRSLPCGRTAGGLWRGFCTLGFEPPWALCFSSYSVSFTGCLPCNGVGRGPGARVSSLPSAAARAGTELLHKRPQALPL
jgi:hypothetical protein